MLNKNFVRVMSVVSLFTVVGIAYLYLSDKTEFNLVFCACLASHLIGYFEGMILGANL
jgi:hypothetical protein